MTNKTSAHRQPGRDERRDAILAAIDRPDGPCPTGGRPVGNHSGRYLLPDHVAAP